MSTEYMVPVPVYSTSILPSWLVGSLNDFLEESKTSPELNVVELVLLTYLTCLALPGFLFRYGDLLWTKTALGRRFRRSTFAV